MSLRGLIAVGAPLGFAYLVHRAISNAEFVDLDFASLFIYLFIALLFALMLTVIYSSMIRESFGDSTWMGSSISQGYDRPHWLLATTSWLLRQEYCFILRWTCFLAVQLVSFTEWAILYKRGMCASREGSWLERYFARHLYHFSNALDAMKASEVLQRHGEQRTVHPDAQVQLFLMRAEMPEPVAISKSAIPGPESEEAQFEAAAASVVVRPVDLNPMPDRHSSVRSLMRNRSIALFEGAEPGGSDWGAHRADAAASIGLPYEDRRSTTILFAAPIPPSVPFNPVRLHK